MLKLINDNTNYRNAKQTFFEADMFAFLNVDDHETGSVLFKLYHMIYMWIYEETFGASWWSF